MVLPWRQIQSICEVGYRGGGGEGQGVGQRGAARGSEGQQGAARDRGSGEGVLIESRKGSVSSDDVCVAVWRYAFTPHTRT